LPSYLRKVNCYPQQPQVSKNRIAALVANLLI
jgi:hypothetical protein